MLITLSGLDGAGKSTLANELRRVLEADGRSVTILTMYDHVGVYAILRFMRAGVRAALGGRRRRGAPEHTQDSDLEVDKAGLTDLAFHMVRSPLVKRFVYPVDVCLFLLWRLYLEGFRRRVLIMDRYFYDSLVDVANGRNWLSIHALLRLVPAPRVPVFVDVSPETAFARKREYSVEELRRRRELYAHLFRWVRGSVILPNEEDDVSSSLTSLVIRLSGAVGA